jgi:hypothetical protein
MTQQERCDILFGGKIVERVNASATNRWYFHFTDGTVATLSYGYGLRNVMQLEANEFDPVTKKIREPKQA